MKKALKASKQKPLPKPVSIESEPKPFLHPALDRALRGFAIFVVICVAISFVVWPLYQIYDERGTSLRHSVGFVTGISTPAGNYLQPPKDITLVVHFDTYESDITWDQPISIGGKLSIDYRIGKSGRIYIESARPF